MQPIEKPNLGMVFIKKNWKVRDIPNNASLLTLFRTREYEYIHFSKDNENYELSREFFLKDEITIYAIANMIEWPNKVRNHNGEDGMWGTIYSGKKDYLDQWPHLELIEKMLKYRANFISDGRRNPPKIIFANRSKTH